MDPIIKFNLPEMRLAPQPKTFSKPNQQPENFFIVSNFTKKKQAQEEFLAMWPKKYS